MNNRSRDLGIGAGKGDNDRTSDVKTFQENLAEIPLNPGDKTGFKQVKPGRYRKTYGENKPTPAEKESEKPANAPTPLSLMLASRARRTALGGSSDH